MLTHKLEKKVVLYRQQYEDIMIRTFGSYVIDRSSMDLDSILFRIRYMKKHHKDLDKLPELEKEFGRIAGDMRKQFSEILMRILSDCLHIDTDELLEAFANDIQFDQNYVKFELIVIGNKPALEKIDNSFKDNEILELFPEKYFRFNTDSYNDGIAKAYPELFENRVQTEVGTGDDKDVFVHSFTFQSSERCSLNCFPEGTYITMADFSRKDISKIRVGDEVLAFKEEADKKEHRAIIKSKVLKVSNHRDKVISLKHPDFDHELYVTKEHPFLTKTGWVNAADIKPSDEVYVTKFKIGEFSQPLITARSYVSSYFLTSIILGAKIREGIYRLGYKKFTGDHHIIFPCPDPNVYDRMFKYGKILGFKFQELKFKKSQIDKEGTRFLYIGDKTQYNHMMNQIQDELLIGSLSGNPTYLIGTLAAAVDTVGFINNTRTRLKLPKMPNWIRDMVIIALNYLDADYELIPIPKKSESCPQFYSIMIKGNESIVKVLASCRNVHTKRSVSIMIDQKGLFKRIKGIKMCGIELTKTVYNFETTTHTYIANDILVHNCTYCVTGDTMIAMADGTYNPIEDIQVGDMVMGFDENLNSMSTYPTKVTKKFHRVAEAWKFTSPDIIGEEICITPDHKVATASGWKKAKDLHSNDIIYTEFSSGFGRYLTETPCKLHITDFITDDVYNIETESHTYIANNMAVHNCYQFQKSEMRMTFDIAKRFIDHLLNDDYGYINRYNSPAIILEFIGGEPLLEINLTRKIYEYFLDRCYELNHPWFTLHRLSICSNGLQYFEPDVQDFFREYSSQISFNISIDGNKELHDSCRIQPNGEGSYEIDMMALAHYNKHYTAERNSKMTLAPSNIGYLYDSVVNFIENGMTVININCVFEEGWEPKHALIEYQNLKRLSDYLLKNNLEHIFVAIFNERQEDMLPIDSDHSSCGGNGAMLSMRPNGDFYPCIRYMPSSVGSNRSSYKIGNVNTGMEGREEGSKVLKKLDRLSRRSSATDICFECPLSNDCFSCIALSSTVYDNPDRRTTFACIMVIAEHLANVYHWNNMLIKHPEWELHPRRIVVSDEWALLIIDEEELDFLKKLELLAIMTYMEKQ